MGARAEEARSAPMGALGPATPRRYGREKDASDLANPRLASFLYWSLSPVRPKPPRVADGMKENVLSIYSARNLRLTRPQRTSSPYLISVGTPVSRRVPLTKVPFIVPISSAMKNLPPRR